jgi:O-antigen/teichoic acid export membrane protein
MTELTPAPTLRSGLSFAALSYVFTIVVALVSAVLISRMYGVRVIGQVALAQAPYFITTRLSTLGERTGAIRLMAQMQPRTPELSALFYAVLKFSTALTLVVAAAVFLVSTVILHGLGDTALVAPSFAMLGAYVVFENVSWNFDGVLASFGAGKELFLFRASQVLTFLVAGLVIGSVWPTTWGLILATIASVFTPLVLRCSLMHRFLLLRPTQEARQQARTLLPGVVRFGAKLYPGNVASSVVQQADVWILGALQPVAVVGAYSRAFSVASRIDEAGWRATEILTPHLVKSWAADDESSFGRQLLHAERLTLAPLVMLAAVGGGVATGALHVFGPGFDVAADAFALLLVARVLYVLTMFNGNAFIALGRPGYAGICVFTRSVLTIGAIWVLANSNGATGVGVAWVLGFVLEVAFEARFLRRLAPEAEHIGLPHLTRLLLCYVTAFAAARACDLAIAGVPGVIVGVVAGTAVFVAVSAASGFVEPNERWILNPAAIAGRITRRANPDTVGSAP